MYKEQKKKKEKTVPKAQDSPAAARVSRSGHFPFLGKFSARELPLKKIPHHNWGILTQKNHFCPKKKKKKKK